MNKDLTIGKASSVLWKFCLPLFGSIIFQQLYNLSDSVVVGQFVSEEAFAAVGNGYEITLIFIAFAFGCNIGCSVVISHLFGAKQYSQLKTCVYTILISGLVLCGVLMLSGILLCAPLLRLIKTPENVFSDCKLYLDIYIYGFPFLFFYNVATGIFSALGDSKTPFIFLAVSSLSNIGVNILFVTAFKMGVAGVAWATFICQGVSCALAILVIFRRLSKIKTEGKIKTFSFKLLKEYSAVAVPSILQQSFISVGNIFIQSFINGYGSSVMAGYSAGVKLNNLVTTSLTVLGNGISNFTAQNMGAEKYGRIREGFWAGLKLIWIITVPIVILYFFFGKYLLNIFLDSGESEKAIQVGTQFLRILSPFYIVMVSKLVADGVLRGTRMMKLFMVTTFTDLTLRVVLAAVLPMILGNGETGIWMAWPLGWVISTILSMTFYRIGKWQKLADKEKAQKSISDNK